MEDDEDPGGREEGTARSDDPKYTFFLSKKKLTGTLEQNRISESCQLAIDRLL